MIVIGSGMYGGYFAAKVFRQSIDAGHPLRVLVLEAGPFLLPEHGQNLPEAGIYDPSGGPFDTRDDQNENLKKALVWGIGWRSQTRFPGTAYCVGGKSLFWGGWCPRLTDKDLEQWPAEVREYLCGKPKVGADARTRKSVYEAVEYEVGARPTDDFIFDPVAGPDAPANEIGLNRALHKLVDDAIKAGATDDPIRDVLAPPIAVQTQSLMSGLFTPDKYSSVPGLISAIRSGDNAGGDGQKKFFLVPNTHVRRLACPPVPKDGADPGSYRVHGIEVVSQGARRTIPVKPTCMVVLALRTIESTRLALESFPTAPGRRDQELVGRNLMAHLRFDLGFRLDRKKLSDRMKSELGHPLAERLQSASLHVQGYGDHGRFHYQVYSASRPGSGGDDIYRMIPDPDVADKLEQMEDPNKVAVIFRACGEMKGSNGAVGAAGTSWIDLAGDGDRDQQFDHARAWAHYENPQDDPIWAEMHTAAVKLAKSMGAVEFPGGGDKFENVGRAGVGTTWHDAGTLRMGDDPADSVTDVNGRFHHIANAACVDQALFPTVGSANPVLTGTCLARKASEELAPQLPDAPAQPLWELREFRIATHGGGYLQQVGGREHALVAAINEATAEVKYVLTNATAEPLAGVLSAAFRRWAVEHSFRLGKQEAGLMDYEGRDYTGLLRHLILAPVVLGFVATHTERLRGEKPAGDGRAGVPGAEPAVRGRVPPAAGRPRGAAHQRRHPVPPEAERPGRQVPQEAAA